jgi:hypothetical protein
MTRHKRHTKKHTKGHRKHKRHTKRRIIQNDQPNIYIQNYGETTTLINDSKNNKKTRQQIKWVGNFKDDKLDLKVDVIKDNDKKIFKINMNKDQIEDILNKTPESTSIAERLTNDFLRNDNNNRTFMNNNRNEIVKEDIPVFLNNELLIMPHKKNQPMYNVV